MVLNMREPYSTLCSTKFSEQFVELDDIDWHAEAHQLWQGLTGAFQSGYDCQDTREIAEAENGSYSSKDSCSSRMALSL